MAADPSGVGSRFHAVVRNRLPTPLHARHRIAPFVRRTPLVHSRWLSDVSGSSVSLKLESLQVTSSFKARGAFNAVIARLERRSADNLRLVTASAGNHGRALAAAGEAFGLPLVVFTPVSAPRAKLDAITRHGAELRAVAADYDEAERLAKAFADDTQAEFISPYNDPDVIDGAATIALEIFEDLPRTRLLVVPIGGGGLISGVAAASKHVCPDCVILGVEAEASHAFKTSIEAGRLVTINPGRTLADGLGGNPDPETITFAIIQESVDRIVTVTEEEIAAAITGLLDSEHIVAEGAGAAAAAALLAGYTERAHGDTVALVTGANIDMATLKTLL
jgi:threonine dehydratase